MFPLYFVSTTNRCPQVASYAKLPRKEVEWLCGLNLFMHPAVVLTEKR